MRHIADTLQLYQASYIGLGIAVHILQLLFYLTFPCYQVIYLLTTTYPLLNSDN